MSARTVITGAGVISPLGAGVREFETALYAGACAFAPSREFGPYITAEIADFDPRAWLRGGIRALDRTARLLSVASYFALAEAGLDLSAMPEGSPDLGLVCGTMLGSVHSIASFDWDGIVDGPEYVSPLAFPNTVINSAAGQAAIRFKLRGVNSTVCMGMASGLYALGYAADVLRFRRAGALLAGGVEELCEECLVGLQKSGALSATGSVRPFAGARDGTVAGEGAALLMLEGEDDARARGVRPTIAIAGVGSTGGGQHLYTTDGVEAVDAEYAIRLALEQAGIDAPQVACIIASASGSRASDGIEARALQQVFGDRLVDIPVCAPKAAFGEAMGGAGAMCAIVASIALSRCRLPPTPGTTGHDGGIRLSADVQEVLGDYALVTAVGCDGNNAALVLHRFAHDGH